MAKSGVIPRLMGESYAGLSPAVQRHYSVAQHESLTLAGTMSTVRSSWFLKPVLWGMRPLNALVPHNGSGIAARVSHWNDDGATLEWRRVFEFPRARVGRSIVFESRMKAENGELVEWLNGGLGLRMSLHARDDGALVFNGLGYVVRVPGLAGGRLRVRVPLALVPLGTPTIVEEEVAPGRVRVTFTCRHPILGQTFEYVGAFTEAERERANEA